MFSSNHLDMLLKKLMDQYGIGDKKDGKNGNRGDKNKQCQLPTLTPSQQLIILGLLGGVFEVSSILVDKDQVVEIIISGSLKRKTQMDQIMDQIGQMPFDDVMKSIFGRY